LLLRAPALAANAASSSSQRAHPATAGSAHERRDRISAELLLLPQYHEVLTL
jgi:hypothetical protein